MYYIKSYKNELCAPSFDKVYETLQKIFNKIFTNTLMILLWWSACLPKTRYQESNMIFIKENWMIDTTDENENLQTNVDMSSFCYPEYCSFSYQRKQHVLVLKINVKFYFDIRFFEPCEELCYIEEIKMKISFGMIPVFFSDQWFLISREDNFPKFTKIKLKNFLMFSKLLLWENRSVSKKSFYTTYCTFFWPLYFRKRTSKSNPIPWFFKNSWIGKNI